MATTSPNTVHKRNIKKVKKFIVIVIQLTNLKVEGLGAGAGTGAGELLVSCDSNDSLATLITPLGLPVSSPSRESVGDSLPSGSSIGATDGSLLLA